MGNIRKIWSLLDDQFDVEVFGRSPDGDVLLMEIDLWHGYCSVKRRRVLDPDTDHEDCEGTYSGEIVALPPIGDRADSLREKMRENPPHVNRPIFQEAVDELESFVRGAPPGTQWFVVQMIMASVEAVYTGEDMAQETEYPKW